MIAMQAWLSHNGINLCDVNITISSFQISTWWITLITLEFLVLKLSGKDDRFALNDSITSISAGMLSQCFKCGRSSFGPFSYIYFNLIFCRFGGRTVAIFAYVWIWNNCRLLELPWESPWTWILCFFTQDFMYYLGHRAVHGIFNAFLPHPF